MQNLSGVWADVLAYAAILAGLAACAGLAVRRDRPLRPAPPRTVGATHLSVAAAGAPHRLDPAREWSLVTRRATQDLDRAAGLAALQAEAALKLAAAEHAYNRLVGDCAQLCRTSAKPTVVVAAYQRGAEHRQLPRTLDRPAERRPLAA